MSAKEEMNALIERTPLAINGLTIDEAYAQIQALEQQINIWKNKNKEAIMQIFKEHDIKSFKNDYISITYIPETTRKTLDKEAVKGLCDETGVVYDSLCKESKVKEQLRISIKGE